MNNKLILENIVSKVNRDIYTTMSQVLDEVEKRTKKECGWETLKEYITEYENGINLPYDAEKVKGLYIYVAMRLLYGR